MKFSKEQRVIIAREISAPDILVELANDEENEVKFEVAMNSNTPGNIISEFAHSENAKLRYAVAKNENATPEILSLLSEDDSWEERESSHKKAMEKARRDSDRRLEEATEGCTPWFADEILYTEFEMPPTVKIPYNDFNVRRLVAGHKNTLVETLTKLAKDEDEEVRWQVAKNSKTAPNVLEELSRDSMRTVRRAVAQNDNTSLTILERLASDGSSDVRCAVAQNSNTPLTILERLATDEDLRVRSYALSRLKNTTIK